MRLNGVEVLDGTSNYDHTKYMYALHMQLPCTRYIFLYMQCMMSHNTQ